MHDLDDDDECQLVATSRIYSRRVFKDMRSRCEQEATRRPDVRVSLSLPSLIEHRFLIFYACLFILTVYSFRYFYLFFFFLLFVSFFARK